MPYPDVNLENALIIAYHRSSAIKPLFNTLGKVMLAVQRSLRALPLLASLLLTFFAYFPGATGYFLFDDNHNIVENTSIRIQSLEPVPFEID